jgi:hypothetical protein
MTFTIEDVDGVQLGSISNSRVGRPLADSFSVNKEQLAADAEDLASLVNRPVYAVVGRLRYLADAYESDAAIAREALDRKREMVDSGGKGLEGVIAPVLVCRCAHAAYGRVGTHRRLVRLLLRGARHRVVLHQDSSTHGRPDSARGANVEAGARGGQVPGPRVDAPEDGAA